MTTSVRPAATTAAILSILLLIGVAGIAQAPAAVEAPDAPPHVLLIDETRTFAATMRVGALAGALRQAGVELDVRLDAVPWSYADPLADITVPDEPYDLILIVPVGIDDESVREVWLLRGSSLWASSEALARIAPLRELLAAVFDGVARPVGVFDDLWVAALASLYETQGWLR